MSQRHFFKFARHTPSTVLYLVLLLILNQGDTDIQRAFAQTDDVQIVLAWSSIETDETYSVAWGDYAKRLGIYALMGKPVGGNTGNVFTQQTCHSEAVG